MDVSHTHALFAIHQCLKVRALRWKLSTDGTATTMKWIWNLSIIMWVTRVNWIQYEVCTYIIESTNFYWEILSRWISREAFPLRGKIYTRRQCNSFCAPRTLCIKVDLFKKSSTPDIFASKQNIVAREGSCTVSIYRYTSVRVFLRNHYRVLHRVSRNCGLV